MEKDVLYELKMLQMEIMRKAHSKGGACIPKNPMQFKIMKYLLINSEKVVYQKDLEEITNTRKSTLSGVLDTMEKNNIIRRVNSEDDLRKRRIILTEEALKKEHEFKTYMRSVNKKIVEGIDESKLDIFLEVVMAIKENIKNSDLN